MLTQHRIGESRKLINSDHFSGKNSNSVVPPMSAADSIISDSIEDTTILPATALHGTES